MFSHGLDLADVMVSSNLLHNAWSAICKASNNQDLPFQVSELGPNGKIIAFAPSPACTVQLLQEMGIDLVPASPVGTFFDFIATKVNPRFSINKAAVEAFASLYDQLSVLQDQIDISKQLLITGNSIGGSIASLFTLWLLDTVYSKPFKRPICITFGSPLLGDINFQKAISERSSWPSCFLHVVSNHDPIPKLFIPLYKPFGSFLFCSESGCAHFDQPESVFELMVAMRSENVGNIDLTNTQINYGEVLERLKENAICVGISKMGDSAVNPLRVGLTLQLEAIGVIKTQQQNNDTKTLIEKLEKRQENILKRKRNIVDPKRKLNDIKISMAFLEWYKKVTVNQGGYYDGYKHADTKDEKMSKAEIVRHQIILTQYWKHKVEEADQMPQKEAVSFRTSWLYAGTNYRRMVEPLDIADYYMRGKRDYINSERSEKFKHYKLMEKWFNDDKKTPSQTSYPNEREKASLTEDSCFWAHVEEAVISFGVLKNGESSQANKNLIEFEDYVMGLIRNCSVSPEIFLAKSTFMKWWKEYKEYKEGITGISYNSSLAKFMRDERDGYI
ncbi:hypothetical protein LguiA_017113 [Lonicera macranthoides]